MKKSKLVLFGSLVAVAVGVLFTISAIGIDKEGDYKKSKFSFLEEASSDDAAAWMAARMRDPETGEKITDAKLKLIAKAIKNMPQGKALPLTWVEEGPDNIGGRTRAILVNRNNNNQVWAGSVSGGLFVSTNGGNAWTKVESFPGVKFISSMAQMPNGTIFVATGLSVNADAMSSFSGDGIWQSSDNGLTWTVAAGTAGLNSVAEIACDGVNNKLWIATTTGLKTLDAGGTSLNSITTGSGGCTALQVSKDGSVIICAIGSNKTYVSTDSGSTFEDRSGSANVNKVPTGAGRIEYAISHIKNTQNQYTLYAVRTGSNLQGMHVSQNGGSYWDEFIGAINPPSNVDIYRGQGGYNTVATVDPLNTERLFVGGIDVWRWTQATNNPPAGGIEPASLWSVNPTSPIYVHADVHEFKWDVNNRLYVGSDGGVGVSLNRGNTWYPANRGYNVTQFYGMAFDKNGSVAGGAQDNGTLYNDHSLSTPQEFREIGGGDGFQCEISFYNPNIIFSTVQYGSVNRSINKGGSRSSFLPDYPASYGMTGDGSTSSFPFYTTIALAEYFDTNSEDSVLYAPNQNYNAGATVPVPSAATGNNISFVTPTALYYDDEVIYSPSLTQTRISVVNATNGQNVLLGNFSYTSNTGNNPPQVGDSLMVNFTSGTSLVVVQSVGSYSWYRAQHPISNKIIELGKDTLINSVAWDTVTVQDPYQSWFLVYVNQNGGEIWGTRDALRLAKANPVWLPIIKSMGATGQDLIEMEFSKDLNKLYVAGGSKVSRIDGLGSIYTSDPDFASKAGYCCLATSYATPPTATTVTTVSTGTVNGIALNPANSNDLIVFPGSGTAKRSLNAGSASPTFTNLSSISGASSPFTYDGIIDRDDSDIIIVATSHGVFVSDNGGSSWSESVSGFSGTPVYEIRQSTRTYQEGNNVPGAIYVATFGRGIWKSSSLLGLKEDNNSTESTFKSKMKVYPNPTASSTSIAFELLNAGNVTVDVFSITGMKVKSITEKNMSKGSNTLELNVDSLPKGTYIVKLQAGSQSQTSKFIKL